MIDSEDQAMSNDPLPNVPPFEEAVEQLKNFLALQNLSRAFLWIFREDVVSNKGRLYVKEFNQRENEGVARALYERGRERHLGVRLEMLCLLDSRPCCYVWLPHDEMEAQYALLLFSHLIISVPSELPQAQLVGNQLIWRLRRWLADGSNRPLKQVPSKLN